MGRNKNHQVHQNDDSPFLQQSQIKSPPILHQGDLWNTELIDFEAPDQNNKVMEGQSSIQVSYKDISQTQKQSNQDKSVTSAFHRQRQDNLDNNQLSVRSRQSNQFKKINHFFDDKFIPPNPNLIKPKTDQFLNIDSPYTRNDLPKTSISKRGTLLMNYSPFLAQRRRRLQNQGGSENGGVSIKGILQVEEQREKVKQFVYKRKKSNMGKLNMDESIKQKTILQTSGDQESQYSARQSNQFLRVNQDYHSDYNTWLKLYSPNKYSESTICQFQSLSNVLKYRVQFKKKSQQLMEHLETKCKIGHQELNKFKPKVINVQSREDDDSRQKQSDLLEEEDEENGQEQTQKGAWWFNEMYENSMARIKDECTFYVHGKYVRFSKNSLGILSNKTKIRFFLVWLTTSKKFEYFIIFFIFLNSLFLGIKDYTDVENQTTFNKLVEQTEPMFTYVFLFECISKILAMGFILGSNSYLSDAWNWLDFSVVVTSLLTEIPSMRGVSSLRTFRLFRPLRSLTTMPSMKLLIGTLLASVSQLGGIMGLALFFFMIFAILGVSLWNGSIHNRCYLTQDPLPDGTWQLLEGYIHLCSDTSPCPNGSYCNSRFNASDFGFYLKDEDLQQDSQVYELNFGITNFDNIGYAFLTIFQCITMDGWTKIMNIYQDAFASWFVVLYFISCVVICSFFLLNLTIAVMLMKYESLDKSQMVDQKQNEELRQIGIQIKLPTQLTEFLINQEHIQVQGGANKMLKQEDSFFKQLFAPKKTEVDLSQKYYQRPIVSICNRIIMNPYFDTGIILMIILNTVCLALDKYPPMPPSYLDFAQGLNYFFNGIFTLEAILKIIGLGLREYSKERFNQFDLLVVIISIVELQFQGEDSGPSVFSSFRGFRLFKIFRLFRAGDLRILLDSIAFTISTIGNYVVLLLLFIYVFALLGMSFFAGKLKFNDDDELDLENGKVPRLNFDTLLWSTVSIFTVLVGDNWTDIMYVCIRGTGALAAVYFVMLVVTGHIIMLNLFLAILLGNFDKARNFGQKKKVFEAFKELILGGISLNQTLDIILGDMSMHVKTKILKWDSKEVERIQQKGDTKIAEELMEENAKFISIKEAEVQPEIDNTDFIRPKFEKKKTGSAQNSRLQQKKSIVGSTVEVEREPLLEDETITNKNRQNSYKLLRLREMNRQYNIEPYPGLKEILQKNEDLDDIHSVDSDAVKKSVMYQVKLKSKMKQLFLQRNNWQLSIENERKSLQNQSISSPGRKSKGFINGLFSKLILTRSASERKDPSRDITDLKPSKQVKSAALSLTEESPIRSDPNNGKIKRSKSKIDMLVNMTREEFFNRGPDDPTVSMYQYNQFKNLIKYEDQEEQKEIQSQKIEGTLKQRLIDYFSDCSLFIFHKNGFIRTRCLLLVESPETLQSLKEFEINGVQLFKSEKSDGVTKKKKGMLLDELNQSKTNQGSLLNKFILPYLLMLKQQPNKVFDNFVLILIIFSSLILAMDNPLYDPDSQFSQIIGSINIVFTCLFFCEAIIKIIAQGLLFNNLGPVKPYLRSIWNILDGFVVSTSMIDLITSLLGLDVQSLQALKALRALRGLRPLRVISKNEGMRLVVNALLASLPSMTNVLLVCSLFILIFSITGVNFFKGAFYSCEQYFNSTTPLNLETIITKEDCINQGGNWVNSNSNFDNCINAMNTLFQMMSTEGWTQVMFNGIDSRGVGLQPKQNSSVWLIIYFVAFMIIGSQFITNLFVGVVIDNFNTIKEKEELGNMFVTEQQRSWIEIQKICRGKKLRIKMEEPQNFQRYFFFLVNHRYFEYFITFFIFLNTIVMAMKYYRMSQELENFSEDANYVFAFVFNMEMILKLIGLGRIYFLYTWNIFDMLIVLATDFGIVMKVFDIGSKFSTGATVFRGFRIMRMFKLIRSSVHIRLILDTVFNILPQISNVLSLILLLFFIYACLGMNIFSGVMLQKNLDDKNNFQTFANSMIILMKFSTGESWNDYMYELANQDGYKGLNCLQVQNYKDIEANNGVVQGCGTLISYPYFISFTILVSMLIMNLSVAAVIEGLDTAKKENMGIVQGDHIDMLIEKWQHYDQKASGWITMKDLVFLLFELPPPLGKRSNKIMFDLNDPQGADKKNQSGFRQWDRYLINEERGLIVKKIDALELLKGLKIKVHQDSKKQVHFVDVVKALLKRVFQDKNIDYKLSPNLNMKIKNQWEKKSKEVKISKWTARQEQAGNIITKWAKQIINAKKMSIKRSKNKKNQDKQQQNTSKVSHMKQQLQDQALIILNMIKEVEDPNNIGVSLEQNLYKIKNTYDWKQDGGDQVLLNAVKEIQNEDYQPSAKFIQLSTVPNEELSLDLFGPEALRKLKDFERMKEQTELNLVQINFGDLRSGRVDTLKKQVFIKEEGNNLRRDLEMEELSILKDKKDIALLNEKNRGQIMSAVEQAEDIKRRYNEIKESQRKLRWKEAEDRRFREMIPDSRSKKRLIDDGITGATIEIDERFLDEQELDFDKKRGSRSDIELCGMLTPDSHLKEDLVGMESDKFIAPSRASRKEERKNL